jgi:salicylate hydroxylase
MEKRRARRAHGGKSSRKAELHPPRRPAARAPLARPADEENIEIRFGARVADVDVAATSVVVGTTGEKLEADVIIAADGVRSIIKPKIVPAEACKAEPTGEAAFRFTLPRTLVEGDEGLLALVQRPWATRWDGPASHVVAYPVRDHRALNVVLIHPDVDYGYGNEGNEASWTTVAEKCHVVEAFKAWSPILHKLIDLAPAEVPNFRMFLYPPAPVWAKGSTILLGDACHAMLYVEYPSNTSFLLVVSGPC